MASDSAPEAFSAKFDLQLSMMQAAGQLWATFDYATDLFEAATIDRMASHLVRLLEASGLAVEPRRGARLPVQHISRL